MQNGGGLSAEVVISDWSHWTQKSRVGNGRIKDVDTCILLPVTTPFQLETPRSKTDNTASRDPILYLSETYSSTQHTNFLTQVSEIPHFTQTPQMSLRPSTFFFVVRWRMKGSAGNAENLQLDHL